ncbi:MAG: hypothetical protein JSV94_04530, partial [Methanobacteriota archaeon]
RGKHAMAGIPCLVSSSRGRIFVDSNDWRRSCEMLSRTFGVVSFSPATRVGSDLDVLTEEIVKFAEPLMFAGASFAIRARRSGNHPYTSQVVCEKAGSAVLAANRQRDISVNLDEPDVEISVEIRDREAFLFNSTLPGPGGLPRSTQGRVLGLLTSRRGIAAAWLLMKRGCTVIASCDDDDLSDALKVWDADLKVVERSDDTFALATEKGCLAIAKDWSLSELEGAVMPKGDVPVFYPLVGFDDVETENLLDKITRT